MNAARARAAALSFEELQRCREIYNRNVDDNITTAFVMKVILAELGQYPSEEEIVMCLNMHGKKINFNTFCKYMEYLKYKFITPEPKDIDTVRAFAALGGGLDRTGEVLTDYLRDTCKHFELRIDIDQMIQEVDQDNSGAISFNEFKAMWDHSILDDDDYGKVLDKDGNPTSPILKSRKGEGFPRSPRSSFLGRKRSSLKEAVENALSTSNNNPQKVEENLRSFFFPSVEKKEGSVSHLRTSIIDKGSKGGLAPLAVSPVAPSPGGLAPLKGTQRKTSQSLSTSFVQMDDSAKKEHGQKRIMRGLHDSIKRVEGGKRK